MFLDSKVDVCLAEVVDVRDGGVLGGVTMRETKVCWKIAL